MKAKAPIYLDYNSTTPVDQRVVEEMLPYFTEKFGNATSKTHQFGWIAEDGVELARDRVAQLIGAESSEIVFTSGATESINLAIKGAFEVYQAKGRHIITVSTEHKAVLDTCKRMENHGASVTYLSVNKEGLIDLKELEEAISKDTILISVMFANNEIGVIQPIKEIAAIAHKHNIIFLCDANQAIGKLHVNVQEMHIDLMPLSAHKFYGPKGVGALYVRRKDPRVRLVRQIDGGGHEKNLRSGTLNVPGIVGLGKASELLINDLDSDISRIRDLRDQLQKGLLEIEDVHINGSVEHRIPNTLNISFKKVDSKLLMKHMSDKIAVSTGSACTSALPEPSFVLKALGVDDETAFSSVRFSLGRFTTQQEVEEAIAIVKGEVEKLREEQHALHKS